MNETDIRDERDNIVISPGLKVRHKKSQYEYTVDSVVKEPNGKITIMLQFPEEPRFQPPQEEQIISDSPINNEAGGAEALARGLAPILYETEPVEDLSTMYYIPSEEESQPDDLLAVDAEEFEKEYEVK